MSDRSPWARPLGDAANDTAGATADTASPAPVDDIDWVRRTLVELDDRQRALDPDDLAARHAILGTIDDLRAMLRNGYADALHEVRERWNERSGRKGGHELDHEAIAGMVRSVMPSR